jgi:hypothetical protein
VPRQSDLERFIQSETQRRGMMWLWGLLGPTGLFVLVVIVMCMAMVMVLSGGNQYGIETYVGSAQALPASWLGLVNQSGGSLLNAVILGDMELESGGQANAMNYNLSSGTSSDTEPIGQPGVAILSADAGLMQINSGSGWPKRPKWDQVFGAGGDPTDPDKNVKEGVKELNQDTRQNGGYLSKGLSAYNTGSGNSSVGSGYANKVMENINSFESGPVADEWGTGNYAGQKGNFLWWSWGTRQWDQPVQNAQTWIMVAACMPDPDPDDSPIAVRWSPPPAKGQSPATYNWKTLLLPDKVTINGKTASLNPKDAPIISGQTVFGLQVTQPGTYTATCEWDWTTYTKSKPPTPVHHKKTAQTPSIEICLPGTPADSIAALGGKTYTSPTELKYQAIDPDVLIAWLGSGQHNSALANMTDVETIISAAQAHGVNPLLLFAITGAEQDFDNTHADNSADVTAIAENPFNIGGSWQSGGYTLAQSADICANFLAERMSTPPPDGESAIEWINDSANPNGGLYASENGQPTPDWWENVSGFFAQMNGWPGMYAASAK